MCTQKSEKESFFSVQGKRLKQASNGKSRERERERETASISQNNGFLLKGQTIDSGRSPNERPEPKFAA
jgi:hypothetical protein